MMVVNQKVLLEDALCITHPKFHRSLFQFTSQVNFILPNALSSGVGNHIESIIYS